MFIIFNNIAIWCVFSAQNMLILMSWPFVSWLKSFTTCIKISNGQASDDFDSDSPTWLEPITVKQRLILQEILLFVMDLPILSFWYAS